MLPLLEIAFTISGTIIAQNIDLTSLGLAAVQCDTSNYSNTNSNKARMKKVIAQGGGITVDTTQNEIVIGPGVNRVKVTANIMAEGLTTYLFVIIRHKKQGQSFKDVTHALAQHNYGYAGVVAAGVIADVAEGDRISVAHDCTGTIRGQYSQVIVEQC